MDSGKHALSVIEGAGRHLVFKTHEVRFRVADLGARCWDSGKKSISVIQGVGKNRATSSEQSEFSFDAGGYRAQRFSGGAGAVPKM